MPGSNVYFGVLNQLATPILYADTLANRPSAGVIGRLFFRTDSPFGFYRDNGTGWDLMANVDTNVITGGGSPGQVTYFSGSTTLAGNSNLFWDNTNSRLGINTATPGVPLDVHGTGTQLQLNGTGTNNSFAVFQNSGAGKWRIGNNYSGATNYFSIYDSVNAVESFKIASGATNTLTITATTNITGTLTATSLVKSGGTSSQLLAADGSVVTAGTGISIATGTISSTFTLAIGSSITSATAGSILFAGTAGVLAQNNANFFWDNTNSRLGIGNAAPSYKLHVTGDGYITANLLVGTNDNSAAVKLVSYSTTAATHMRCIGTTPTISFADTVTSPTIFCALGMATVANNFVTGTTSGDFVLVNQRAAHRVYIVSNTAGVYLTDGATAWTANSDITLKNINYYIENAVEKLYNLSAINYSLKEDITNKPMIGLIAQEVQKVLPDIVETSETGILGLRYTELIPVIIKAIQELKDQIDSIKIK